jgi:hypothetical protein
VPGTPAETPAKTDSTSTTTTNPDGSKTTVVVTTTTAPDGTKGQTTTTTTTNPAGTVTNTSTTTTGGNGAVRGGTGAGNAGNGAGAGCSNGDVTCDGGGDMPSISDLYTKKDKTYSSVLTAAKDQMLATPVISSASHFLNVGNAGACPNAAWSIPYLNATVPFDMFCNSTAALMFALMRGCVMAVAAFFAFRIAFL